MKNTVMLNIPRLGGMQEFEIITKTGKKDRYVCSTWDGDGLENEGNWDIIRLHETMEYVAMKA